MSLCIGFLGEYLTPTKNNQNSLEVNSLFFTYKQMWSVMVINFK